MRRVNPLTPVLAVTGHDEPSTSDVITFDQNWHHLCSTSAGGKYLSSDTQTRVIGPMEPEKGTKMLNASQVKNSEKISCHYTWLLHGKNCPSR